MIKRTVQGASAAVATALALVALPVTPASAADYDVLVFSKTVGYRHGDAIDAGKDAIREIGAANGFTVTTTEDAAAFTSANLAKYEAVVFLNTTTTTKDPGSRLFTDGQRDAFEEYIRAGGGFLGIHSAADTEYGWPFYGGLVGAYFDDHGPVEETVLKVEDRATAATAGLPQKWTRTDEWYNFQTNPRSSARVLASLDGDRPHMWCKAYQGGRSFYVGGGHTAESFGESHFRSVLLGGIRYAAGQSKADCRPETGYTSLYNGSTAGWSQAGPGGFTNSDATLRSEGGMGLLWYNAKQYSSYSLKLDWKMAGDDNSGVFIGFPPSDDPMSAVDNGYEIQIDATDSPDGTTGAVYRAKAADQAARDAALNPPGQWNTYELLVEGERLQVFLNGVKINDFANTDPARSLAGHIGIQNHGAGDDVSFRNIRIKDLGGASPATVQAESFSAANGVEAFDKSDANGGKTLGYIDPGDWARYDGVPVNGATGLSARVVSGGPGGTLQVRTGSPTGPILGSVAIPNTGDWSTFKDVSMTLSNAPAGTADIFLTFAGSGSGLFDVDDFTFTKTGSGTGPIKGLAGKCLDVQGASSADGTQIQLYDCNGSGAQSWTRAGQTLKALGKCLDVNGAATTNGAKVQLHSCNGTPAQNWVQGANDSLVNPNSGKCLDVEGNNSASGTRVLIWDCNGGANQRWTLPA